MTQIFTVAKKCDPNQQRNLLFPHYSLRPLWSDDHDDEEVISGNKPPGLCEQDVYVQMSDSAYQLIIGTLSVSYHF